MELMKPPVALNSSLFCAKIRTFPHCKHIPAVMLTARGFDVDASEMAEAGISKVLEKPFSPREILSVVNSILANRQADPHQAT